MKKLLSIVTVCCFCLLSFSSCGSNGNNANSYWVPVVTKAFGKVPTVKYNDATGKVTTNSDDYLKPPNSTETTVLTQGTGRTVENNDTVVVNYFGFIYNNTTPFDMSFSSDREPLTFKVGSDSTIKGLSKGLQGQKVGSRVIISIPPADAYGSSGYSDAGIGATDVLEFVVDIIADYPESTSINNGAQLTNLNTQVKVTGVLGSEPDLNIIDNGKQPNAMVTTVIAKGTGTDVKVGNYAVVQYKSETWSGQTKANTWSSSVSTIEKIKAVSKNKGTLFSNLAGLPIGSRVLVQTPEKANSYPSLITVIDIIDQITPTQIIPAKYKKYNKKRLAAIEEEQQQSNLVGSSS